MSSPNQDRRVDDGGGRSACTTYAPQEAVCRVLRTRDRVGRGERPLRGDAGERERSTVVGERRERRVGLKHDPAVVHLEAARLHESRKASSRHPLRKPVAQITCSAHPRVALESDTRNRDSCSAAQDHRLVHAGPGGYDGVESSRSVAARASCVEAWNAARPRSEDGRGTLSGRRSGSRRQPDDLAAGRERIQPLRCGRHAADPGADPRRVLVGLVRVHRVVHPVGTREPRVAGRHEDVREGAAVEREPAVDRLDPADPLLAEAPVPAGALAHRGRVLEEADARVVAVRQGPQERRRVARAHGLAHGQAGEGRGAEVAVRLRAHAPLPDRRGADAQTSVGSACLRTPRSRRTAHRRAARWRRSRVRPSRYRRSRTA